MHSHQPQILRTTSRLSLIRPESELRRSTKASVKKNLAKEPEKTKKVYSSRVKILAEAVILQAVEDLWSNTHRQKSIEFFMGSGFRDYADMAGMGPVERLKLIRMIGKTAKAAASVTA